MRTIFEHIDDMFHFGKFKGCTLAEVLTYSPSYLEWIARNVARKYWYIADSALMEVKALFPHLQLSHYIERITENYDYNEEDNDSMCDYELDDSYYTYDDKPTYDRYCGSYAQDVAGYSDDDIDTIFDGDPDAYWNID